MRYEGLYALGCKALERADIAECKNDARLLLEYVCGTNRNDLLVHGDREVEEQQEKSYMQLLEKRGQHIPLQQLTGIQSFMGFDFLVNENVLIPRQDTEILVEEALMQLHDGMRVLDLCTGSGCILLSLLLLKNDCSGVGVDLSEKALEVAERNKGLLGENAEQKVSFVCQDAFAYMERAKLENQKFEMIVSNPPYINSDVIPTLMPEVRDHEPMMALDGGADGMDFYRGIVERAPEILWGGGMLFFEIGYDQGERVSQLMRQRGFAEVQCIKDYAGLDRVVFGTWI